MRAVDVARMLAVLSSAWAGWGFAIESSEPRDLPPAAVLEDEDFAEEGQSPADTPVYFLQFEGGRLSLEQAPWQRVAAPFDADPGNASYRNEPVWEPGVIILNF